MVEVDGRSLHEILFLITFWSEIKVTDDCCIVVYLRGNAYIYIEVIIELCICSVQLGPSVFRKISIKYHIKQVSVIFRQVLSKGITKNHPRFDFESGADVLTSDTSSLGKYSKTDISITTNKKIIFTPTERRRSKHIFLFFKILNLNHSRKFFKTVEFSKLNGLLLVVYCNSHIPQYPTIWSVSDTNYVHTHVSTYILYYAETMYGHDR